MTLPKKLLLSNFLNHNVRCDKGIDHGPGLFIWMHPPVHRVLGWISRPSNFRLQREVWRLDQVKGINQQEVYVKGNCAISDQQSLDRFPTLINSYVSLPPTGTVSPVLNCVRPGVVDTCNITKSSGR